MALKKKPLQVAQCILGMTAGLRIRTGTSGLVLFQPLVLLMSLFLLLFRATSLSARPGLSQYGGGKWGLEPSVRLLGHTAMSCSCPRCFLLHLGVYECNNLSLHLSCVSRAASQFNCIAVCFADAQPFLLWKNSTK